MPDNLKDEFPKVPPFFTESTPGKPFQEPASQPRSSIRPPEQRIVQLSQRDLSNGMILLVSITCVSIAMAGAAWVGFNVLTKGLENQIGILPKITAIGLAYVTGWIVSVVGIRVLRYITLSFVVQIYAGITLFGLCVLQAAIITKLFDQSYSFSKFTVYLLMMGIGLLALIGFHRIDEKHNLVPFSFPILTISLFHLVLIVAHYVFPTLEEDKYIYFWGDAAFFLFTTITGVLMLTHSEFLKESETV